MTCLTSFVGPVFFVRWQAPEIHDLDQIRDGLAAAYKAHGGQVTYIAIIPEDCPAPSTEVRKAMMRTMDDLLDKCSMLHFVIEGMGFKHSMLRSVLAGILLVSGKRGRCLVHTSVEDAFGQMRREKVDINTIRRSARVRHLIP